MTFLHPDHLDSYTRDAFSWKTHNENCYLLSCTCAGQEFNLFESDLQSVLAECAGCQNRITVYDLENYPAAIKLQGAESFSPMVSQLERPSRILATFEYGPPEDDVVFDRNDITWCQIHALLADGSKILVFDDETC